MVLEESQVKRDDCCSEGLKQRARHWGCGLDESMDHGGGGGGAVNGFEPQDADYSYVPALSNELALLILARVPLSEHRKLCFINQRYLSLLRNGELYKIRREIGMREASVFMLAGGESRWRALDPRIGSCRDLPELPSDACFKNGDKESFCAGTHLLVSGKELEGMVIWRYELAVDRWFKGPHMMSPRCLFASATASCCEVAYVAGGVRSWPVEVLNTAEQYNSSTKSWKPLPRMICRRRGCSGCYMDGRFYVIGGVNEKNEELTSGEFYDRESNRWHLVPNMMMPVGNPHHQSSSSSSPSPPLVAVVKNELYSLDATSNQLRVYVKGWNSWRELGEVPVRADESRGWGVAFKSLGEELLVIGNGNGNGGGGVGMMMIFTCSPDPSCSSTNPLQWRLLRSNANHSSPFVFNCSVMVA
ncbi:hypothetical protein ACLOJK_039848 [Asimina triloba]